MHADEDKCKVEEEDEFAFPPPSLFYGNFNNFEAQLGRPDEGQFFESQQRLRLERKTNRESKIRRKQNKNEPSDAKIKKINERRGKYKRSTNNSHKKFICVARRLLFKFLNEQERQDFQKEYLGFKNSRAYYFIILAFVKLKLSAEQVKEFIKTFVLMMNNKIEFYKKEIRKTDNKNFINFRYDEISDIQYAMRAFELYFENKLEESIETIYKKEKITVLKKHQFEKALSTVRDLERKLLGYSSDQDQVNYEMMDEFDEPFRSDVKGRKKLPPPAKIDVMNIIKNEEMYKATEENCLKFPKTADTSLRQAKKSEQQRLFILKLKQENSKFMRNPNIVPMDFIQDLPLKKFENLFPFHPFFFPETNCHFQHQFIFPGFEKTTESQNQMGEKENEINEEAHKEQFFKSLGIQRTAPSDINGQIEA